MQRVARPLSDDKGRAGGRLRVFAWSSMIPANLFSGSAFAQIVLIPHGDFENDFEKYLVVIISLALLGFAAWRFFRGGR
ncbi:MAG TPA: hypothetical protein VI077_04505 [Pseudolabrys sp.]|jgi:hypothetical protein